jgi:hypothetical protein
MNELLFPQEALDLLGQARWDPNATRDLEQLTLSFCWSDELHFNVARICLHYRSYAYQDLLVYRTSLIRGEPDGKHRAPWDQLRGVHPGWPGFRPERYSMELKPVLDRAIRGACIAFQRDFSTGECADPSSSPNTGQPQSPPSADQPAADG